MADRRYEIEIVTTHTGRGAPQAEEALRAVEREAESAAASLDRLKVAQDGAQGSSSSAAAAFNEVTTAAGETARSVDDMGRAPDPFEKLRASFAQTKHDIDAVNHEIKRQAADARKTAQDEIAGIFDNGLSALTLAKATKFTAMIAGAFAFGKFVGEQVDDMISTLTRLNSPVDGLRQNTAEWAEEFKKAGEVSFADVVEDLNKIRSDFDGMRQSSRQRMDAVIATDRAGREIRAAGRKEEQSKALAGASSDAERSALGALFKAQEARAQHEDRMAQAVLHAERLQNDLGAVMAERARTERASDEALASYQNALRDLASVTDELAGRGLDARALLTDKERLASTRQGLETSGDMATASRLGELVRAMELVAATRDALAAAERESSSDLKQKDLEIGKLRNQEDEMRLSIQVMQHEFRARTVELGAQLQKSISELGAAITQQRASVDAAQAGVNAAQIAPGADQSAALANLQSQERGLDSLLSLQQQIREQISALGRAGQEGAESAARAMQVGKSALEESSAGVTGAGARVAADVGGAAKAATDAMSGAQGKVVGGINSLGVAIEGGFNNVTTSLSSVIDRIAAQESRLRAVADRAAAAEATAQIAAAQAAANR